MYYFYMGSVLLPIAPEKFTWKVNGANKTMTLINEGEVNFLRDAKLTDFEFDALIPAVQYAFAKYDGGFKSPAYFTSHFEKLKTDTIHDMEDAYGVLPYPLLNGNQKKYLSGTVDHYSVLSVPFTNFDLTKTGAVIEAISAYNNLNINELYYESIVTHRQTRDPESVRMIDIIMEGRVYDLTTYHYNELKVSDEVEGSLGLFFRYVVCNYTEDIHGYWQASLNHLPDDLDELINDYINMFM